MKTLLLNQEGDLEFGNQYNLKMVEGVEEVNQRLDITISTNQGEWIFNTILGIPWIKIMNSKGRVIERIENHVARVLRQDEDIAEIIDIGIDYDRAKRFVKIKFHALLENGERFSGEVEVI